MNTLELNNAGLVELTNDELVKIDGGLTLPIAFGLVAAGTAIFGIGYQIGRDIGDAIWG